MKKIFILFLFPTIIEATFFLNRYWVPELVNQAILSYKRTNTQITIQPFIMTASQANTSNNITNPNIYEIDGIVTLANLNYTYLLQHPNEQSLIPSEWIAYNYIVPLRLNGKISSTGIAWNIEYQVTNGCSIGWASGYSKIIGAMNIQPQEEASKYKLKEGLIIQINEIYNTLTKKLNLFDNYTSFNNFADQDFYIRFELSKDYALHMRKIKLCTQLGGIVAAAHTTSIKNPADIPGGTNGFNGIYGAAYIDLLLKEDVNFAIEGKLIYLTPGTKEIRTKQWFESNRFGGYVGNVDIAPGFIYNFSPTLSIEGIRRGLGFKVNYSTWGQAESRYGFTNPNNVVQQIQMNIESETKWNQEHCNVTVFYDFDREAIDPITEKYLAFSADIPVDFFFAHNSAKSLGISLLFQILY